MTLAEQIDLRIRRALAGLRLPFHGVMARCWQAGGALFGQADALAGEQVQGAEYFQHYGYASRPKAGAKIIVLPLKGRSGHAVIIASQDRRYVFELEEGEVALHTDEGDHIHLKRGNEVEIKTKVFKVIAEETVEFETPEVKTNGSIIAKLDVKDRDGTFSMAGMRSTYDGHKHGPSPTPTPPMGGA